MNPSNANTVMSRTKSCPQTEVSEHPPGDASGVALNTPEHSDQFSGEKDITQGLPKDWPLCQPCERVIACTSALDWETYVTNNYVQGTCWLCDLAHRAMAWANCSPTGYSISKVRGRVDVYTHTAGRVIEIYMEKLRMQPSLSPPRALRVLAFT